MSWRTAIKDKMSMKQLKFTYRVFMFVMCSLMQSKSQPRCNCDATRRQSSGGPYCSDVIVSISNDARARSIHVSKGEDRSSADRANLAEVA